MFYCEEFRIGHQNIIGVDFDNKTLDSIINCINKIKIYSNCIDYGILLEYDLTDFLNYIPATNVSDRTDFIHLNSKFLNWLSAFYLWKSSLSKEIKEPFEEIQTRFRSQENQIYRLVDEIRNYSAHRGFAIDEFRNHLRLEEKIEKTIEKYMRDIKAFWQYAGTQVITKELAIAYKENLLSNEYTVRSVNSMIA